MMKKNFLWILVIVMLLQLTNFQASVVSASGPGDVVINEIAWAGTADSSNDEWIELYNNSNQPVDLSGWSIDDDGGSAVYLIESGEIAPRGYFLIEDSEETVSNVNADALIGLSLANSGDSLVLKDASGVVIDAVNSSGSAYFAGDSVTKASMERIDPLLSGDLADNWGDAVFGNASVGRLGSDILGTPGSVNSVFAGASTSVSLNSLTQNLNIGDVFTISADITGANDVYAYGFDLIYDAQVLNLSSVEEGDLLSKDFANTSFFYALENGVEGKLVVGNSRLTTPLTGVSGDGNLFNVAFQVIGVNGDDTTIGIGGGSFVSDTFAEIPVNMSPIQISTGEIVVEGVLNPEINLGTEMYSLELSWGAPLKGADTYIIKRENFDGSFVTLAETDELFFIDSNNLIPNLDYNYQIVAVKGGAYADAVVVSGMDNRGIIGDNNRNGRVDGRDLERLARAYGSQYGDANFYPLLDTTYDGRIDGSDLIDIGASFGLSL